MNFYQISVCVFAGALIMFMLAYSYKIHFWKYGRRKQKVLPSAEQNKNYAIFVPARDESKVIRGILDSIKKQTYKQENLTTYIIVEDNDDPTIEICKEYKNTTCYVLPKKPGSKAGALKIITKDLYDQGKRYDGYFIIDADNILFDDFVENMHNALCAGNDLVLGGRISTYPSGNAISAGSTLTWTFLNTLNNKCRSENGKNIIVQGSPLLISKTLIEDFWHGEWPEMSLTEDLDITYICNLNNFKTFYYEYALVYDVQPNNRKAGFNQRMRWVKGHHQTNKKYYKQFLKTKCKYNDGIYKFDSLFSLFPAIAILVTFILFILYSFIAAIVLACLSNPIWIWALVGGIVGTALFYLTICFWTLFAMISDNEKLHMTVGQKIQAFFTVPFFYFDYLPIYVKTLFAKDVKWTKIDHTNSKK